MCIKSSEKPMFHQLKILLNEGWNINMDPARIWGHLINPSLYLILSAVEGESRGLLITMGTFPDKIAYSYYRQSFLSPVMRGEQQFPFPIPKISLVNVISFQIFSWEINSPFTITSFCPVSGWPSERWPLLDSAKRPSMQVLFHLAAEIEAVRENLWVNEFSINTIL